MKKKYIQPELDILQFGEEDIITSSVVEDFDTNEKTGWVVSEEGWD